MSAWGGAASRERSFGVRTISLASSAPGGALRSRGSEGERDHRSDGLVRLEARLRALPEALAQTLAAPLPALDLFADARRLLTTGVGGSEGPARVLAAALREWSGRCASFVPLSRFAVGDVPGADALAVISQGLSPNAQIALRHRAFDRVLAITSEAAAAVRGRCDAPGLVVTTHPPAEERGLLARVIGPPCATLTALRVADALSGGAQAPPATLDTRVREALERVQEPLDPTRPLALVSCDLGMSLSHGLRWRWIEATRLGEVSEFDALGFAHGGLQLCAEGRATVVILARAHEQELDLAGRVEALAARAGCETRVLRAAAPGPWSFFEHDAAWGALITATLRAHPHPSLDRWPLQGDDGALYELDAPLGG